MQHSTQKRGQVRLVDAPPKPALGSLEVSKRAAKVTTHRGDVVGATVGETSFGVGPDGFVGVELRGVGRKAFEMQPREPTADFPNRFSFVNAGVVPDHDDVPAEVAQQVPEEFADLVVPDVLHVALEVQADAPTPGSQGWPRGAQVFRTVGIRRKPDSSTKTMWAPSRAAFFLPWASSCASSDR